MSEQDARVAATSPDKNTNDDELVLPAQVDPAIAEHLVEQAKEDGVDLVGPNGLLGDLTKQVLEAGLEVELEDHLGYPKHAQRPGGNARNGTRSKTVITEVGPVEVDVPRDRDGSFEPKTVKKRQRRLRGVDSMVISLVAKGLTTGEVQAHLAETYGTEVSRETISKITDRVLDELAAWTNRPLDRVYPVVFVDAIYVKIRDGQVTNRPCYCAIGVTVDGKRDILGLWIGSGASTFRPRLQNGHRILRTSLDCVRETTLKSRDGPIATPQRSSCRSRRPAIGSIFIRMNWWRCA